MPNNHPKNPRSLDKTTCRNPFSRDHKDKLVGGDWNHGILWLSHQIGKFIIPTDFHKPSFFRGLGKNHQPARWPLLEWFSWRSNWKRFPSGICRSLLMWVVRYSGHDCHKSSREIGWLDELFLWTEIVGKWGKCKHTSEPIESDLIQSIHWQF